MKKVIVLAVFFSMSARADYNFYTEIECPVVGNIKSKIYHIPGGQSYFKMLKKNLKNDNRKCFNSQIEALNSGYRKAKI